MPVHLIYNLSGLNPKFKMNSRFAFGNEFENGFEIKEKKI